MSGKANQLHLDTRAIHAGEPRPRIRGAITQPIFQSSTFEAGPDTGYHDLGYIRLSNTPNHASLHAKLADLEATEAALVTASGMAAITTSLLTVLHAGDHLLVQDTLYGGTHNFVTEDLRTFGIDHDFIDAREPGDWEQKLKPNTRAVYVETLTNPLLQVAEHVAVASFARAHGLVSLIDNTMASPVNFTPALLGYDLVLHSATKYLNGHSDIVAGVVAGSRTRVQSIKQRLDHLGGSLDPHACFLLHRGLKTLGIRVRQHNANALALAQMLDAHPRVRRVYYPGLTGDPQHARASTLFQGCGGLLSFEPETDGDAAQALIERLQLAAPAPSLGGVESLITRPAATTHAGMTAQQLQTVGIRPELIRVAVGIEHIDDLRADFEQALAGLAA